MGLINTINTFTDFTTHPIPHLLSLFLFLCHPLCFLKLHFFPSKREDQEDMGAAKVLVILVAIIQLVSPWMGLTTASGADAFAPFLSPFTSTYYFFINLSLLLILYLCVCVFLLWVCLLCL